MPEDARAQFAYFQWSEKFNEEKPYYLYMDPPKGLPTSNFSMLQGAAELVHDLSQNAQDFNLDDHGFMVAQQSLCVDKFDQETVERDYLPSLEKVIRDAVGQEAEIVWFDWRTRSSDESATKLPKGTKINLDDRTIDLSPVKAVHINLPQPQSIESTITPGTGRKTSSKGVVWRPYEGPVESCPIAVLDGSTVPEDKLVRVDVVRRSYIGECYYVLPHGEYRWYFINNQRCEDVLLFKMYDSDQKVKAKCMNTLRPSEEEGGDAL
ncbi:hypothetical protein ACJ41O_012045 [Fusarium nematophilum]